MKSPIYLILLCTFISLFGCQKDVVDIDSGKPVDTVDTTTDKLSTPSISEVLTGDRTITLKWAVISNATSYELWINTEDNLNTAQLINNNITNSSYTIFDLINGTIYYFWIRAKNENGISDFSSSTSGKPSISLSIPSSPKIESVIAGSQQIIINWSKEDAATTYEIWINTLNDSNSAIPYHVNIATLSYTINNLVNETTYYIWVRSRNSLGISNFSDPVISKPKKNTNAYLSKITVSTSQLVPVFSKDILSYTLNLSSNITDVSINAFTDDINASTTSQINITNLNLEETKLCSFLVLAEDGITTKEYLIYVTRNQYSVGDIGPAGGCIFYDKGYYSNGWRFLESAPNDTTFLCWFIYSNSTMHTPSIVSAKEKSIGSGKSNTAAIVTALGITGNYAARYCDDLVLGGKDDWFLPSLDELNIMYSKKNIISGWSGTIYWSSTQDAGSQPYWQNLFNGVQSVAGTADTERVRAIRSFCTN